jgi:hypothetical protein
MSKVNLDALLKREDFETGDEAKQGKKKETISIEDLKSNGFFYSMMRKPDFQRETNEWDKRKICDFIESFLDGDLIPAIILWQNPYGLVFIIDGSHRLSSIIAWLNDDYGDGKISKEFYDDIISDEQIKKAEDTRKLVKNKVGSFSDFELAVTSPKKVRPKIQNRVKNLSTLAIQLQWVEGDASKAESSFFKINQKAAPIDKTELVILESRHKPNCIAARAIINSGKGHKYWSAFTPENQQSTQNLAKQINDVLFTPPLKTPLRTHNVSIGGQSSASYTLPMLLQFVNIANNAPLDFKDSLDDDATGQSTIEYLENALTLANRINSTHNSSLGLHPLIYFYSMEGKYKISSFLTIIHFVKELVRLKQLKEFTSVRDKFEDFLIKYDYVVQQINRKYRSTQDSYPHVVEFYLLVMHELKDKSVVDAINNIVNTPKYKYLSLQKDEYSQSDASIFSITKKSAVFIKEILPTIPRCKICKGFLHQNSISIDHITRRRDGGKATTDNGQLTHPFCNIAFKN